VTYPMVAMVSFLTLSRRRPIPRRRRADRGRLELVAPAGPKR